MFERKQKNTHKQQGALVVGYDPKDGAELVGDGFAHWSRRHGSPFHVGDPSYEPAYWVPMNRIPCLKKFHTCSDFVLMVAPSLPPPRFHKLCGPDEDPSETLRSALANLSADMALLSIEFTYNMDFGTNLIARAQNLLYPAMLGIPTFVVAPGSAVAIRGAERLGDKNTLQKRLEAAVEQDCEKLVRNNEEVSLESVLSQLDQRWHPNQTAVNLASWKAPLLMSVIGDSYKVPGCVVELPQTVTFFPNRWKLAGKQMAPIWNLLRESLKVWRTEGRRLHTSDSVIRELRDSAEKSIRELGVPVAGPRSRNTRWDEICQQTGFPPQSRCDLSLKRTRAVSDHYPPLSPELTTFDDAHTESHWQKWVQLARVARTASGRVLGKDNSQARLASLRERRYGPIDLQKLPQTLRDRRIVATLHIADHTGRYGPPLYQNLIERTYLGRAISMDLINFRVGKPSPKFPRAGAVERKDRTVIYAADLPIDSKLFCKAKATNVNVREWFDMIDIFVLEDGIFLGSLWSETGELVRVSKVLRPSANRG